MISTVDSMVDTGTTFGVMEPVSPLQEQTQEINNVSN